MHYWKVVPFSKGQLLDINPTDVLENGLYRRCDTHKGGGGYDQFPLICERRITDRLLHGINEQFVVQLFGCNLDCPYCYVTREGVWGKFVRVSTEELVKAFIRADLPIFHLMGGAPALQLDYWPELIFHLKFRKPKVIFHSDLLLTEGLYSSESVSAVMQKDCLYAVNIKGSNPEEYERNTRKKFNSSLFWANFSSLLPYRKYWYITFTGVEHPEEFWYEAMRYCPDVEELKEDSFSIDIIQYEAQPYVDHVPWGAPVRSKPKIDYKDVEGAGW